VKIMVITKDEPMSQLSVDTIKQLFGEKDAFISENSSSNGGFVYSGYLSGAAVSNYEISDLVTSDFNSMIIIVIVLLILLLFVVMRSYLTPLRAVFTIVMSVIWTLGLTYLIFQYWLNIPVVWIVPIILFVVCLGLGMDYDILLTTRIKENVSKGMSNDDAIVDAIQRSGAVITLCGLIMAGAFGTMMLSTSPMLMEFGFALGFAIAVDALLVRTYIVPALMHLMGKWNWKGPDFFFEWRARRKEKSKKAMESE
jgi:RND superfamily putative drug exporter